MVDTRWEVGRTTVEKKQSEYEILIQDNLFPTYC